MANQESDHSRLETPLRPHSLAGGWVMAGGLGPVRAEGADAHSDTGTQQQHQHPSTIMVGTHTRMCSETFHSSIPRTSVIMERPCIRVCS